MKIRFLDSALDDLEWFKLYYEVTFPQGAENAFKQFLKAQNLLEEFPFSGYSISKNENLRHYPILKTPFSLYYVVDNETVWITRVIDNRALTPHFS